MSKKRRCICGQSKVFPLCDYTHHSEDWQCMNRPESIATHCFIAGAHHLNYAEKLASEFRGIAAHLVHDQIRAEKCFLITDGTDLDSIQVMRSQVNASQFFAIGIGVSENLLRARFPKDRLAVLPDEAALEIWAEIKRLVDSDLATTEKASSGDTLPRVFLSHAVHDEAILQPAIEYLRRQFSADLFLCSDSIQSGSHWQKEIVNQLESSDMLVWILSEASIVSTFCSFEVGFASAIKKPIRLVSLDGTMPPPFAQQIQVDDLKRRQKQRPWLEEDELLLEVMMEILSAKI